MSEAKRRVERMEAAWKKLGGQLWASGTVLGDRVAAGAGESGRHQLVPADWVPVDKRRPDVKPVTMPDGRPWYRIQLSDEQKGKTRFLSAYKWKVVPA